MSNYYDYKNQSTTEPNFYLLLTIFTSKAAQSAHARFHTFFIHYPWFIKFYIFRNGYTRYPSTNALPAEHVLSPVTPMSVLYHFNSPTSLSRFITAICSLISGVPVGLIELITFTKTRPTGPETKLQVSVAVRCFSQTAQRLCLMQTVFLGGRKLPFTAT